MHLGVHDPFPGGGGTVADVLLKIHRSYVRALSPVLPHVHAMAHVTGGGLPGNLNRALRDDLDGVVDTSTWTVPHEFLALQRAGAVAQEEMFRTFNMGVGMVVLTEARFADAVVASAQSAGVDAWPLGRVVAGSGEVILE
jgi:phosphoribosylformylglycinamidine cyclo-ligase